MRHFNLEQNSGDWFAARAGLATTSNFDKIITKKTYKPSSQADAYANHLIAELILGKPIERNFSTWAQDWGRQHEGEAVKLYEFDTGLTVKPGGFFTDDDLTLGSSPDARVYAGDELVGIAEIKCPEDPATHIEFLLMQEMNPDYVPQVQGQLYVSGLPWVDWFSYYPEMPPARIRVHRDEKFLALLENALKNFNDIKQAKFQQLIALGHLDEIPVKHISEFPDYSLPPKPLEMQY